MKTKKKASKPKATHRIEFYLAEDGYRWRARRIQNRHILADSGEAYRRRIDAERTVERFLAAVRAGTVEVER